MTNFDLAHLLYQEDSFGVFLLVTVFMGGGAAWLTGRAIAATWRPWWQVPLYMILLALAVRFIHFALFEATLLTLHYYLVDVGVCLIFGALSFRATRARQMAMQYGWLYTRSGWLRWTRRSA
jgi:hypothetical protein